MLDTFLTSSISDRSNWRRCLRIEFRNSPDLKTVLSWVKAPSLKVNRNKTVEIQ